MKMSSNSCAAVASSNASATRMPAATAICHSALVIARPGSAAARESVVADDEDFLRPVDSQMVAARAGVARDGAEELDVLRIADVGDRHVVERRRQAVAAEIGDAVVDAHRIEARADLAARPALTLGPWRALVDLEVAVAQELEILDRRVFLDLFQREAERIDTRRDRNIVDLRGEHLGEGRAARQGDRNACGTEQLPHRHRSSRRARYGLLNYRGFPRLVQRAASGGCHDGKHALRAAQLGTVTC